MEFNNQTVKALLGFVCGGTCHHIQMQQRRGEGDAAAGVYAMDGAITRAGVNARAIKLQAVAIIAGSAIKLPTENAGEGLLRDITQVHCDIKNRTLGGAQLNGGQ